MPCQGVGSCQNRKGPKRQLRAFPRRSSANIRKPQPEYLVNHGFRLFASSELWLSFFYWKFLAAGAISRSLCVGVVGEGRPTVAIHVVMPPRARPIARPRDGIVKQKGAVKHTGKPNVDGGSKKMKKPWLMPLQHPLVAVLWLPGNLPIWVLAVTFVASVGSL